jgi:polyisoprenoid-binding protein YceI
MRKIMTIALMALTTVAFAQLKDGKYILDYKTSKVDWRGENLVGGGHDGFVKVSSGNVVVTRGNIASGKIKINMNDITCTDISDPGTNSKLINHLKAEDFFYTEKYPDAIYEITNCAAKADGHGNSHVVKGKMTIKGISKELEFPVKIEGRDGDMKVTGDIVFDRSLFDIKYPSVGNYAAKNEIKLKLNISSKI